MSEHAKTGQAERVEVRVGELRRVWTREGETWRLEEWRLVQRREDCEPVRMSQTSGLRMGEVLVSLARDLVGDAPGLLAALEELVPVERRNALAREVARGFVPGGDDPLELATTRAFHAPPFLIVRGGSNPARDASGLTEAQRDGRACVYCASDGGALVPTGWVYGPDAARGRLYALLFEQPLDEPTGCQVFAHEACAARFEMAVS
jgi:hypothetical protein